MADSAHPPRHAVLVRITHWINTAAFFALIISGIAILLAHPRLYWGETGGYGSPAWLNLPLPLDTDQSGWGRSLHFLAAWICVLNGTVYILAGLLNRHFTTNLAPTIQRHVENDPLEYNTLQKIAYLAVIFVLFPLMIATGLAMSPAITSVFPVFIVLFGGYQSSRTIHFLSAAFLVLFLVIHVVMVYVRGFRIRMNAMIFDRVVAKAAGQ